MLRNILFKLKSNKPKINIKKNLNNVQNKTNKMGFKARAELFNTSLPSKFNKASQIKKPINTNEIKKPINNKEIKKTINNKEIKKSINNKEINNQGNIIDPLNFLEDSKYNYDNIDNNLLELKLDYYIIHLERSTNRKKNIKKIKELLNKELIIFNAIDGNDISEITNDTILFNKTIIDAPFTFDQCIKTTLVHGEIGNYLSHLSLLYKLKELNINDGYTIIFEDDVIFKENLDNKIRGILGKITDDFDLLYLGNTRKNYGNQYIDEIHYVDKNNVLWGTYGYLINNKNINKLYDTFNHLYVPTDLIMKDLIDSEKINGFVLAPCIVIQNFKEFPSEIIRRNNNLLLKYLKNKKIRK